ELLRHTGHALGATGIVQDAELGVDDVGDPVLEQDEDSRGVIGAQPVAGAQVLVDPHPHLTTIAPDAYRDQVLDPDRMSPRTRRVAAALVHRTWRWASKVGMVSPDDDHGFRSLGAGSMLAFPPGDVFGEWWITIGTQTMIAPEVALSVGMPTEVLDRS